MYDIKALLNEADALTVAQYLGMDIRRKGSKYFIRCPGHEKRLGKPDEKISNCVITKKGYHCYACEHTAGLIEMVQDFTGCDFKDALDIIANTCGGSVLYQEKGGKKSSQARPTLSAEDLELIGLNPNYDTFNGFVINGSNVMPQINATDKLFTTKKGDEYLVCQKQETLSLSKLFSRSKKIYNQLISQKAEEAMMKYKTALDVFCSRDGEKADIVFELLNDDNQISDDAFQKLTLLVQSKYYRAKEIYEEYTIDKSP